MSRIAYGVILALALTASAAPALAQYGGSGGLGGYGPIEAAPSLQDQIKALESQAATFTIALEAKKKQVEAGAGNPLELFTVQDQLRTVQMQIASLKRVMEHEQRAAPLKRAIDLQARDVPVRELAQALAKASGVAVEVDEDVPNETRLTVQARRVPLATVLEAVGRQADLMISPSPKGVRLRTWPSLEVQSSKSSSPVREVFYGGLVPWSDEWGTAPTAFLAGLRPPTRALGGGGGGFGGRGSGLGGSAGGR
jgi:hypothetical protein